MSPKPFASRNIRAVVTGGTVILIAVIAARGTPGVLAWTIRQQQLATRSAFSLADARGIVDSAPAVHNSARAGRLRLSSLDSAFVAGNSVLRGVANLVSEVSENAEVVGAKVDALQADSVADTSSAVRKVRVRGSVSGDLATLMQFLLLIETGPRLLVIRDLSLSRREVASATQAERIQASFVVEGLVRTSIVRATR